MIHSSLIIIDDMLRNILLLREEIYELKVEKLRLQHKIVGVDNWIDTLRHVTNEWWSVYPPWG